MPTLAEISKEPSQAEILQRHKLLSLQIKGELNLITAMSILGTADTDEGTTILNIMKQIQQSFDEDPILDLAS